MMDLVWGGGGLIQPLNLKKVINVMFLHCFNTESKLFFICVYIYSKIYICQIKCGIFCVSATLTVQKAVPVDPALPYIPILQVIKN